MTRRRIKRLLRWPLLFDFFLDMAVILLIGAFASFTAGTTLYPDAMVGLLWSR